MGLTTHECLLHCHYTLEMPPQFILSTTSAAVKFPLCLCLPLFSLWRGISFPSCLVQAWGKQLVSAGCCKGKAAKKTDKSERPNCFLMCSAAWQEGWVRDCEHVCLLICVCYLCVNVWRRMRFIVCGHACYLYGMCLCVCCDTGG